MVNHSLSGHDADAISGIWHLSAVGLITFLTEADEECDGGEWVIDNAAVERFGAMLRAEILGKNTDLRLSYVQMLVGNVSVNDNKIVIAGSTAVLEAAATKGGMSAGPAVRGFDRKWCRLQASNLLFANVRS